MILSIIEAAPGHVAPIAARMRTIDRLECAAAGHAPDAALAIGLAGATVAWSALVDGEPQAMFGVSPRSALERSGIPWFLGSDAVLRHGRALLRFGPAFLDRMHADFPRLDNAVSCGNRAAIRLLKRWGFVVEPDLHMIGNQPFHFFWSQR
ncbi:hypothetical protein [Flavisphingomonas formosensis]|uniref:hypothetical protein n=1 Tax=Flavisphingomonas formosensis TaxID=861534 RepID=UPI0012F918AC|nr:hypothetical protein [Sphingomonas formosensis]